MRFNPQLPAIRFGAWNTPLSEFHTGNGWDEPPSEGDILETNFLLDKRHILNYEDYLKKDPDKPRVTVYHELGHLLMMIALGFAESVVGVQVFQGSVFFSDSDRGIVKHYSVGNEQEKLLIHAAGQAMVRLLYCDPEHPENGEAVAMMDTRVDETSDAAKMIEGMKVLRSKLKNTPQPDHLKTFLENAYDIVDAHLKQFDRGTVVALAKILQVEKEWDHDRIQELNKQFNLDQFSS